MKENKLSYYKKIIKYIIENSPISYNKEKEIIVVYLRRNKSFTVTKESEFYEYAVESWKREIEEEQEENENKQEHL